MMYNKKVMDHFMNPRNVGEIADPDGMGEVGNLKCGDIMRIYLRIDPTTDVIEDIKFKTFGCGSAVASSSIATEMIMGKTVEEALKLTNKDVLKELGGLPTIKVHCSVLAEQAFKAAAYDYATRHDKHYAALENYSPEEAEHDHHHDEDED
ncbi:MAG TPA: Fe-S cluster assembly scaffold protein NifU [Tissierellia bacterium]|nr:Fe-S cluster assembly scaffold protein NifU [Tissierellia bacterium]